MMPDLVSKDELIAVGWKDRQVDAALDEPDEHGPSRHWQNTSGTPYYRKDRVAVAAYRTGLTNRSPPLLNGRGGPTALSQPHRLY
jgi:hypothetical protein